MSTVRTRKLCQVYDVSLIHSFFPLHPDTPPEGLLLSELFRGRGFDLDAMHARMKGLMDAEGLPYARGERTYNSRLAQELGKWGEQAGKPEIHGALYRAYFVEGVNLADTSALVRLAQSIGLDEAEAQRVLADRSFKDTVDADWARARALGVTGVPTFVAGDSGVVGAQPYEVLEQLARRAGATRRAP